MTDVLFPPPSKPALRAFFEANPGFDIRSSDLHPHRLDDFDWSGVDRASVLDELKAYQRLARLGHGPEVFEPLRAARLDSAHRIARLPESAFVRKHAERFPGGADQARAVHRSAVDVRARATHVHANVKNLVASRHYLATLFQNVTTELIDYVTAIPSYEDLFGGQDYCACADCLSIFGPAAYFLDLMRITDQYITEPNTGIGPDFILPGMTLAERRPDLFKLLLDCANTNTLVSYLSVVNTVLATRVEAELEIPNAFKQVALADYPLNLPFHLPLEQIRANLDALKTSLFGVYQTMLVPDQNWTAFDDSDVAHEYLTLSVEQANFVTTSWKGANEISRIYGYSTKEGSGLVTATAGESVLNGQETDFVGQVEAGDLICVEATGETRTVRRVVTDLQVEVDAAWSSSTAQPSAYSIEPIGRLSRLSEFLARTGLDRASLESLLVQNLDEAELRAGLADAFYINADGSGLPAMRLEVDSTNPNAPFERIANQTTARLDRVNRFIRLATWLGWSFADLNWAMVSARASEIDDAFLQTAAKISYLNATTGIPIDLLCAFWYDIKTTGRVTARNPQDPFDRIFNNPVLLDGQNPYDASTPEIPFDPARPLTWQIDDRQGKNGTIRSRLTGALLVNDNALTQLATYVAMAAGTGGTLELTLAALTNLYRLAKLASVFKLTVDELVRLLTIAGSPIVAGAVPSTVEQMLALKERVEWLRASSFTVYDLEYVVTGIPNEFSDGGYKPADVRIFVENLAVGSEPSRVTAPQLVFEDIDMDGATPILEQLRAHRIVNRAGVAFDLEATYERLLTIQTVTALSLVSDGIGEPAAAEAFRLLVENGVVLGDGYLEPGFGPTTDLDFLFAGDSQAEIKRGEVRSALLRIQSLAIVVRPSSFVGDDVDERASEAVFADLVANGVLDANGRLSQHFDDRTDLDFLFAGDPKADLKRGEVRAVLLQVKRDIEHTVEVLKIQSAAQRDFVVAGLSQFLRTTTEIMRVLLPFVAQVVGLEDYLVALLTPAGKADAGFDPTILRSSFVSHDIDPTQSSTAFDALIEKGYVEAAPNGQSGTVSHDFEPDTDLGFLFAGDQYAELMRAHVRKVLLRSLRAERVLKLVAELARALALATRVGATATEIRFVIDSPEHFDIADLLKPTFKDVRALVAFRRLVRDFGDAENGVIAYFEIAPTASCPDPKIETLARLTGWDVSQICKLIERFWPRDSSAGPTFDTVQGLARLGRCFDLSAVTGVDVFFLLQLADLRGLSLVAPDGGFDEAHWTKFVDLARSTLDAVSAKLDDAEFAEIAATIASEIDMKRRNALVGYTIWLLNKSTKADLSFIERPSDLYQYLLVDVETSGCASTTPIAQAIASVQLYMQRARMSLEDGVTDLEIPADWWDWMSTYRAWEANRKVFLYPENYLESSLRRDQTPPFRQLSDALLQTELSERSVTDAYSAYFEEFTVLAGLVICGSYSHVVLSAATGQEVETIYVFGRTPTEPYVYYLRTVTGGATWSAWERVDVTINAAFVTPCYAFDRLFVFWVELQDVGSATLKAGSGSGNESQPQSVGEATIRYAVRGLGNRWSAPQTLVANVPIDVSPDAYFDASNEALKRAYYESQLSLRQPYAVAVDRGIPGSGRITISGQTLTVGKDTRFKREVAVGDEIWCADEVRRVVEVKTNATLYVDRFWSTTATEAVFRIVPRRGETNEIPPFGGAGAVTATAGKTDLVGVASLFTTEITVGDRVMVGAETRVVVSVADAMHLTVDSPWKAGGAGSYTVFPIVNGSERLLVLYGPTMKAITSNPAEPTPVANPGKDDFIAKYNAFNKTLYDSLLVGDAVANVTSGRNVTLSAAGLVDADLLYSPAPLSITDYLAGATDAPRPYRPAVDRYDKVLSVEESQSALVDNYWGSSAPGTRTEPAAGASTPLLYNVAGDTAVLSNVVNRLGRFVFYNGDETFLVQSTAARIATISSTLVVRPSVYKRPWQSATEYPRTYGVTCGGYTDSPVPFASLRFAFSRASTVTAQALRQRLFAGGVPRLLALDSQRLPELPFTRFYLDPNGSPPSAVVPPPTDRLDFDGAYGEYFWEIFFHGPFLVAEGLRAARRFAEARAWYQYVFDPTARPDASDLHPNDRYWRFLPFRELTPEKLADILTNPRQIAAYNDDPFDPDAIARLRPTAYAKAVVMRYIDNLLDWGDLLFAQDTAESITSATNVYVMAADLLGKRPEAVGVCDVPRPRNFADIRAEYSGVVTEGLNDGATEDSITLADDASPVDDYYLWMRIEIVSGAGAGQRRTISSYDGTTKVARLETNWDVTPDFTSFYAVLNDIPQFLIELENTSLLGRSADSPQMRDVPFNDVNSYFCVPENAELIAYWDRVEDRLYKIRHCMNIQGIERSLSPFAPPVDVRALVRASAAGAAGYQLAAQIEPPVPNYRFQTMLTTARSLTSTVMQLGSSLLAALEQRDAEELSLLRASQETALLNLATSIKRNQIVEVEASLQALAESRTAAQARLDFYTELSATGLSAGELQNLQQLETAMVLNVSAGVLRTAASVGYALPNVGSPFAMTYGGSQIGSAVNAASGALEVGSLVSSYLANRSLTMAGYMRRAQDWDLQAMLAGYDVTQIASQIAAADAQRTVAEQDLAVHLRTLEQSREVELFVKDKFTNQELFAWMAGRISAVYFQTYALAFELARSAQRAFQYELSTDQTFVNFGYWDGARQGLLAGEGLMLALNQMEKSYLDANVRTLEIERTVSLGQLNPKALLDLRRDGVCAFELSERLYDYDFPGHYRRKIKSVSVSIPAIVGPYQNVKATLTQLSNHVVQRPDVSAVNFLLGGDTSTLPGPGALRSNWRVNQQIALSRGANDAGLFQLSLDDDRYLPFEGTGAVSTWRLEIPKATNRLNLSSIADVAVTVAYTAHDGGRLFRAQVTSLASLRPYYGSQLVAFNQLYSQNWFAFMQDHSTPDAQTLRFELTERMLPPNLVEPRLTGFYFVLDAAGRSGTGKNPYITFQASASDSETFDLDATNTHTTVFRSPIPMADVYGERRITFKLDNDGDFTPAALKKDGFLDPDVVKNIVLVLYYDAEVDWA